MFNALNGVRTVVLVFTSVDENQVFFGNIEEGRGLFWKFGDENI